MPQAEQPERRLTTPQGEQSELLLLTTPQSEQDKLPRTASPPGKQKQHAKSEPNVFDHLEFIYLLVLLTCDMSSSLTVFVIRGWEDALVVALGLSLQTGLIVGVYFVVSRALGFTLS